MRKSHGICKQVKIGKKISSLSKKKLLTINFNQCYNEYIKFKGEIKMEKLIQELKERLAYYQNDLNYIHSKESLIFIRGQIAGIKESLKILGIKEGE
jgi:hypothetical protein